MKYAKFYEIREILPYIGRLAKVPGAKSWVKGLANIRGILLPVIDLSGCLDGKPISIERHTRMLIINQAGISAGFLHRSLDSPFCEGIVYKRENNLDRI